MKNQVKSHWGREERRQFNQDSSDWRKHTSQWWSSLAAEVLLLLWECLQSQQRNSNQCSETQCIGCTDFLKGTRENRVKPQYPKKSPGVVSKLEHLLFLTDHGGLIKSAFSSSMSLLRVDSAASQEMDNSLTICIIWNRFSMIEMLVCRAKILSQVTPKQWPEQAEDAKN